MPACQRRWPPLRPAGHRAGDMRQKMLLVTSGGGHWVPLLHLRAAWDYQDAVYLTAQAGSQSQEAGARFCCVRDATG